MNGDTPELRKLVLRVERLERQNWRLKRIGIAALVAFGGILLMGQAAPTPKVIEAQKFVLKDSLGRTRAELSMGKSGEVPGVRLFDNQGKVAAIIAETTQGPILRLAKGRNVSLLFVLSNRLGLNLASNGGERVELQVRALDPDLKFYDRTGSPTVILSGGSSGTTLSLSTGKQTALIGIPNSGPVVETTDANGFSTALGSTEIPDPTTGAERRTSAASIVMFGRGKERKVIWKAPGKP